MRYRDFFKGEINEDPDSMVYGGEEYIWHTAGKSTFSIYMDNESRNEEWIGVQYNNEEFRGVIASKPEIKEELRIMYDSSGGGEVGELSKKVYDRLVSNGVSGYNIDEIGDKLVGVRRYINGLGGHAYTHGAMAEILVKLGRFLHYRADHPERNRFKCAGRLFNIQAEDEFFQVFGIWNDSGTMVRYKEKIFTYLKALGMGPKFIQYQCSTDNDDEYHSYDDMFVGKSVNKEPNASSDTYNSREAEWKAKQHAAAGMLPKGWRV